MQKILLGVLIVLCAIAWTWRLEHARPVEPEWERSASSGLTAPEVPPAPSASEARAEPAMPETDEVPRPMPALADAATPTGFACDGRQYCSQMTSCEEATYFLQHCPDTKMDGDGDGVPCERQWCGR
jgi:hypothetical protein